MLNKHYTNPLKCIQELMTAKVRRSGELLYPSCVESHFKMRLIRIISRCEHAADLVRYVLVALNLTEDGTN